MACVPADVGRSRSGHEFLAQGLEVAESMPDHRADHGWIEPPILMHRDVAGTRL
jgi:hypothetical protein